MEKTRDRIKLFSRTEVLDTQKHKELRWLCLKKDCTVGCCKIPDRTYTVLDEIIRLSKHFPVVFTVEVDEKGKEERLICAYFRLKESNKGCVYLVDGVGCAIENEKPYACRQYPFFINNKLLAVDLTCPGFSYQHGEKVLTDQGISANFEENFFRYSLKLHEQKEATQHFVNLLFDMNLIVPAMYVQDGVSVYFNMVDEERLLNLERDVLKDFVRLGYMRYIYAHLNSLENWKRLVEHYLSA